MSISTIKLTQPAEAKPIWVNPDKIATVTESLSPKAASTITLQDGSRFDVIDLPQDVIDQMAALP